MTHVIRSEFYDTNTQELLASYISYIGDIPKYDALSILAITNMQAQTLYNVTIDYDVMPKIAKFIKQTSKPSDEHVFYDYYCDSNITIFLRSTHENKPKGYD